jgi:hypothetical protein
MVIPKRREVAISDGRFRLHASGMRHTIVQLSQLSRNVIATVLAGAAAACAGAAIPASPPSATAAATPAYSAASSNVPAADAPTADAHDGQRDFDFMNGRWKVQFRRLKHPLSGSTEWEEGTGTAFARPMWNGKAQIDELEVDTPRGHVEGMTVRIYSAATRKWSLYWANQKSGRIEMPPTVGSFKDGRGEFFDEEDFEGKHIVVRYVWSNITATSALFEQSFSPDGGKTWEVNWVTELTRIE